MDRDTMQPTKVSPSSSPACPGRFTDLLGIRVEQAGTDRTVLTMECGAN